MSVRHMILGILYEEPTHGYNIKKVFYKNLLQDFGINDGQLYPALNQLEQDGLISKEIVVQEKGPNRHRYSISEHGKKEFFNWLEGDEDENKSIRYDFFRKDRFLIKCNFLQHLKPELLKRKILAQITLGEKKLADFSLAHSSMTNRQVKPHRLKILELGINLQEARLNWLRGFIEMIENETL